MKPYIVRGEALFARDDGTRVGSVGCRWTARLWFGWCGHCDAVKTRTTPRDADDALWRHYLDEHTKELSE